MISLWAIFRPRKYRLYRDYRRIGYSKIASRYLANAFHTHYLHAQWEREQKLNDIYQD